MSKHAYGNTETVDLWNAWSEVSGKDISGLMATWTKVTGYPYLRVVDEQWGEGEVRVTLEQSRFLSDGSAASEEEGALWSIPLLFATAGFQSQEAVIMDKKQQTFSIPVAATGNGGRPWLRINAGQKALIRVAHSPEMIARLQENIAQVAPVDRAALLLDAYALAKAGLAPPETVVEILRALRDEEASIVWSAITGVLGGLHLLLEELGTESPAGAEAFKAFVAFGKTTVTRALEKVHLPASLLHGTHIYPTATTRLFVSWQVGWDTREGESHTDKLMRASVMELLDSFAWDDAEVATEAKRRFDAHWEDPSVLPSEYKVSAAVPEREASTQCSL